VYNPTDDQWTEMAAPSQCEGGRRLAVYDGRLLSIGGLVGDLQDRNGSTMVEVFDFQAGVWRPETDMNVARCFHGVAVA